MQIRHDRCLNCNQCSIASVCPSDAISRVAASEPYKIKGKFIREEEG
jgi:electron transport complex protein RnfB